MATAHGFRVTVQARVVEMLEYPEALVEMQLDRVVKDADGTTYNRTEIINRRLQMMTDWADYLVDPELG